MNNNDSINKYLSHIVIDPYEGTYTLLDHNFKTVDTVYRSCNIPVIKRFHNMFKLRSFKKEVKSDFKKFKSNYKQYEKESKFILPSMREQYKSLKTAYHNINKFLFLCSDADYQILTLIKNNITKINPYYKNYLSACAEYLDELASDDPDACNLPFDLNYACNDHFDDLVLGNHFKLANTFEKNYNPVEKYINIISNRESCREFFRRNHIYRHNEYTDYTTSKSISLDISDIDDDSYSQYSKDDQAGYVYGYPSRSSSQESQSKYVYGYPSRSSSQEGQSGYVYGYPSRNTNEDPNADR